MNELEKCAEILVLCGYAEYTSDNSNYVCWHDPDIDNTMEAVQLFADTLEGRRQLETIYNYYYGGDFRKEMIEEIKEKLSDEHDKR